MPDRTRVECCHLQAAVSSKVRLLNSKSTSNSSSSNNEGVVRRSRRQLGWGPAGAEPDWQQSSAAALKDENYQADERDGQFMRHVVLIAAISCLVACCSQEQEPSGRSDECARRLYPSYNPSALDQCVDICKKCQRGVTTTCTTSCTLRGAR